MVCITFLIICKQNWSILLYSLEAKKAYSQTKQSLFVTLTVDQMCLFSVMMLIFINEIDFRLLKKNAQEDQFKYSIFVLKSVLVRWFSTAIRYCCSLYIFYNWILHTTQIVIIMFLFQSFTSSPRNIYFITSVKAL